MINQQINKMTLEQEKMLLESIVDHQEDNMDMDRDMDQDMDLVMDLVMEVFKD